MNVQNLADHAQHLLSRLAFGSAPAPQRAPCLAPVADVAIGNGDELNMVPEARPHGSHSSGLELAIIRMSAEANDTELTIVIRRGRGRRDRLGPCGLLLIGLAPAESE